MTAGSTPSAIAMHEGTSAMATLRADWVSLWSQSTEATESQSWDWNYLYCKHMVPNRTPVLVLARDARGECVAIAPFFTYRDHRSGLRTAAFLGEHDADYHMILVKKGTPEDIGTMMFEALDRWCRLRASFVELSNIPDHCWTASALRGYVENKKLDGRRVHLSTSETYAVALPASMDEYLEQLGPRMRRHYGYDEKRLSRECEAVVKVCSSSQDIEESLDGIERIDWARWGSKSRYVSSGSRSFHRSVAEALCKAGMFRAFVLYLNGQPCAYVSGVLVRDSFKVPHVGYDPSVPGKYSIGRVINFIAIRYCIESGYKEYDLTRGSEAYKAAFGAQMRPNLHARLCRSRLDAWAEVPAASIVSMARGQQWLRRMYKRLARSGEPDARGGGE